MRVRGQRSHRIARGLVASAFTLALAATIGESAGSDETASARQPTSTPPAAPTHRPQRLEFHSEIIRLRIAADTLEVEGEYRFLCPAAASHGAALFYPYPIDSLLGEAHTVSLATRPAHGEWQPAPFKEVERRDGPGRAGARWRLPSCTSDTLEVHTIYRQALAARYARYIVTSTKAWQQPLVRARFEIYLPENAVPRSFSYAFERVDSDDGACYVFETEQFLPDRDIVVEWEIGAPSRDSRH
jgi:hypothetical protein